MKKEYYSESLDKILKKNINISNYGLVSGILRDIFQRRAYEFGFSDKHMESEIKNFKKNCKDVGFFPIEYFDSQYTLGLYSHSSKSIRINLESVLKDDPNLSEEIYEILTHEVYHAISARKDKTSGLTYKDKNGEEQGTALNEIFNEVAANRTSRNITLNNETRTDGYGDLTPAFQMLSLSLGIPQKELLRAGIQNREELMKCIQNKFQTPEQFKNATDLLKAIELNLNGIYNFRYIKKGIKNYIQREGYKTDCEALKENFKALAEYQMSTDPSITPEEKSYRLARMEEIQSEMDCVLLDKTKPIQTRLDSQTRIEKFEQEYDGGKEWDNENVTAMVKKVFNFNKMINPVFLLKKLKNSVKTQKNKFLEPGKKENEESVHHGYRETEFDRKYKVRPEDLRPMEEVRAETARKMELKRQREATQNQETESHFKEYR